MFSKILVPVDGSENSYRSLNHALYLHSKIKSHLTILYVIEVPPFVYIQSQKMIDSVMAQLEKEATNVLERCKDKAKEYDTQCETIILEGSNPGSLIIDYSENNSFDCVVMGSRGKGTFKHAILGSVSNRIVQHSKIPVLVIK
jgi:nucleotide-binding universal stress UspA family protein